VSVGYVQPNWHIAPFDHLDARIAFDAAIDRDALDNLALHGADVPTIHYLIQGLPGYNPNLVTSWGATGAAAEKGDTGAARAHITAYAQAACGGDVTRCPPVTLFYAAKSSAALIIVQVLLQQWQQAMPGYPISIQAMDFDQLLKQSPTLDLVLGGWIMDYPADEDWTDQLLQTGAAANSGSITVPQADALASQADTDPDAAHAETLYREAEQLWAHNVGWLVFGQDNELYVVRPNVVGYKLNASGVPTTATLTTFYLTSQ
jgi:ABC-type transport system substrate-binding protein